MSDGAAFEFYDLKPSDSAVLEDVLAGLTATPKRVSPKFFYDERGSKLFEAITELPEYYPTRTELAVLGACLPAMREMLGSGWCLVEYGAGTARKVRKLLEVLQPAVYLPVDISAEHLRDQSRELHADFPWLEVYPTGADFTSAFELPAVVAELTKVGFFPGSSIGNFEPAGAKAFLENVARTLGPGGYLIIGIDRKKDVRVLEAAYNDAQGVTAQFNLNVLNHLNELVGSDFDTVRFTHRAHYDERMGCIQMFVKSKTTQRVRIGSTVIGLEAGELIHTENSYKYHVDDFIELASTAGFRGVDAWSDTRDYFSVLLLRVASA
ncbi:MAG: L-histidine N(alpha)-methyltransferase [Pseudomonadales bacterium]|jgi:dimethylhistidine N-methyltransferase|nr:L-histidine N(alpha)-methyltransferase [Pseudomonadales bacterium]MDP6471446.1 L-histidine N(alpha)-methyltransferase [Pseudomonadales bacterium]MDP6828615.1 L-histidine N(alpha)-methyltransferase [Pseudomonadales bacterium]MDP6973202.1 L-histidine N(alpha)-methyltransferase [Pseudomonadales bacterium]